MGRRVSWGGCAAFSLWWSLGAAGLNYTRENLCLTSEARLTWDKAQECDSLLYCMLCPHQSEQRRKMCVCGKAEKTVHMHRTRSCVFLWTSSLVTVYWYCIDKPREYTCDCEGELRASFDTWKPNKQLRAARTEPRAINSTDIWASGSVYRLISQHTTRAYPQRRILTWASSLTEIYSIYHKTGLFFCGDIQTLRHDGF